MGFPKGANISFVWSLVGFKPHQRSGFVYWCVGYFEGRVLDAGESKDDFDRVFTDFSSSNGLYSVSIW